MTEKGLKAVRQLMDAGFSYDNLRGMELGCREEAEPDRMVTAFVLQKIFVDLAGELGDRPVLVSTARKMEARYRTMINLALERAISGASPEEQHKRLTDIIYTYRDSSASDRPS